jgi:hypothetical protein
MRLQFELKNIQILEEKALTEERARNSWLTYAFSSVFGAAKEPEVAKQERDMQHLQRLASKTIKEKELSRKEDKLKEWNNLFSGVEKAIAAEISSSQERVRRAAREKEEARRQEELKAWKKQHEEFLERERANRAAAKARAAKEHAAAEALRRAAEEQRKKEEEARRQREVKEAEERRKAIAEMLRKMSSAPEATIPRQNGTRAKAARATRATPSSSTPCQHKGWWDKVEHGSLRCGNCDETKRRFVFQCPDCQMRACAECRISLKKGGKPRAPQPRGSQRSREGFGARYEESYDQGYDESFAFDWYD